MFSIDSYPHTTLEHFFLLKFEIVLLFINALPLMKKMYTSFLMIFVIPVIFCNYLMGSVCGNAVFSSLVFYLSKVNTNIFILMFLIISSDIYYHFVSLMLD